MAIVRHFDPTTSLHMFDTWLEFLTLQNNVVQFRGSSEWRILDSNGLLFRISGQNLSTAPDSLPVAGRITAIEYLDTATGQTGGRVSGFSIPAATLSREAILAGDDTVHATLQADVLAGMGGADTFVFQSGAHYAGDVVNGGRGADTLRFASALQGDALVLNSDLRLVEKVTIADGAGRTSGTTALDIDASGVTYGLRITGNDGANEIMGTRFADVVEANGGGDQVSGGEGDNLYIIAREAHGTGDFYLGGTGHDEVRFTSVTAGETLHLNGFDIELARIASRNGSAAGTAAVNIDAAGVSNGLTLTGNDGDNLLIGSHFGDVIRGQLGADTLAGNGGGDRFDFDAFETQSLDVILDFESGSDIIDLSGIGGAAALRFSAGPAAYAVWVDQNGASADVHVMGRPGQGVMTIGVTVSNGAMLTAQDFIL